MSWLLRHNWAWTLAAFLLGAVVTWLLLSRRTPPEAPAEADVEVREEALVGAAAGPATRSKPARPEPASPRTEPAKQAKAKTKQPKAKPVQAKAEPAQAQDEAVQAEPETKQPEPVQEQAEPAHAQPAPVHDEPVQAKAEPMQAEPEQPQPEPVRAKAEPEVVAESQHAAAPPMAEPMTASTDGEFSRVMGEPTLFDDEVPVGRFGPGSADAVPHQGPPDGFTIKGNAQSMLFHTPDSPYYGRTKAEVWFRTEGDAERAGFTKYVRKPRKSTQPGQ